MQKAEFECKGCSGETEYSLTYTFGLTENVTPRIWTVTEVRGPARACRRCWYLWKCGMVRVKTFGSRMRSIILQRLLIRRAR